MAVLQVTSGRFHHFHMARQMERLGLLKQIWTGYPMFKLREEQGVPRDKIKSFPYLQTLYMASNRVRALRSRVKLGQRLAYWAQDSLDWRVALALNAPDTVIALSGSGLRCGTKAQRLGGRYVCDRGSSHIRYQDEILGAEHRRWGVPYTPIYPGIIEKEEREYAAADRIFVPSGFVLGSFLEKGVGPTKLVKIPYGANTARFKPIGEPEPGSLNLLFVGQITLRKGVPYLLEAFARLKHPRKQLTMIGAVYADMVQVLPKLPTEGVTFLGNISNRELPRYYSAADALVLPSIEEGLAMVMAEALACGCPVVATRNTGAEDLFGDGEEGFVLPIRDVDALTSAFEAIADQGRDMRPKALARVGNLSGWDGYGDNIAAAVATLSAGAAGSPA